MKKAMPMSLVLALALGGGVVAACGGPAPKDPTNVDGTSPGASGSAPVAPPTAPASGSSSAGPVGSAPGPVGSSTPPGPAFQGPMKTPIATALGDALKTKGLDVKNLPALNKMEPKKLRDVMQLFTQSLGAKCSDCHVQGNFAAPTPRKKIAARMWDDFVRGLAFAQGGGPVFCDSCHQGKMTLLDRGDKKALSGWMKSNMDENFKRKDGKDHGCTSSLCHGSDMEMHFVKKWGEK